MTDEQVVRFLEEIRDLQKESLANQKLSLQNQEQSLKNLGFVLPLLTGFLNWIVRR